MKEESPAVRDRRYAASLPKIRDVFGYGASLADANAELATKRYEYALDQRDRMQERLRFGAITLNAASLLAIGTILGNRVAVSQLGILPSSLIWPATIFAIGLACGALAIWVNGNHLTERAGQAAAASAKAASFRALFDDKISEHAEASLQAELDEAIKEAAKPPPDFTYSKSATILSNFSCALWLTGLMWVVLTLFM